jgi:ABC-type multidrug transport system fused ATPase/permease subunit
MRMVASWRALLRLLEGSGHIVAASVAISIAQALLLVPIAFLVRRVFNTSIPDGDTTEIVWIGALALLLLVASAALGLLTRWLSLRATKDAITRLRARLLEKVMLMPRSYFDRTDLGTLHSTIVQDSERLDTTANAVVAILLPSAIVSLALCGTLVVLDPLLAALVLLAIPAMVLAVRPLGRSVRGRTRVWQRAFDRFSSQAMVGLRASTLTKLHGAEGVELERRRAHARELGEAGLRMAWVQTAHGGINNTIAAVIGVIVLVVGGVAVAEERMSIGDLVSFYAVLGLLRAQVGTASIAAPQAIAGSESLTRLEDFLADAAREPYADGRQPLEFAGGVELRDVHFAYEPSRPVLGGADLRVDPGETVLLLGPNGAGKSTVINLVAGLYAPSEGSVLADGTPLDQLDISALRPQMGVVPQDPLLLPASVRDNIAFGRPDATAAEVEAAAARAGVDGFIASLPGGYDAPIGDDGVLLSGGQRQRIALARALLSRPALLMLDEPSTHLDNEGTADLLASLREQRPRPSVLLVTHDPALTEAADRVLELRDGRIAERRGAAAQRT